MVGVFTLDSNEKHKIFRKYLENLYSPELENPEEMAAFLAT